MRTSGRKHASYSVMSSSIEGPCRKFRVKATGQLRFMYSVLKSRNDIPVSMDDAQVENDPPVSASMMSLIRVAQLSR